MSLTFYVDLNALRCLEMRDEQSLPPISDKDIVPFQLRELTSVEMFLYVRLTKSLNITFIFFALRTVPRR